MKNTIRVRNNGGKAAVSSQSQTSERENKLLKALELRPDLTKGELRDLAETLNTQVTVQDVLLELILNRADWENHRCGADISPAQRDRWNFGIEMLADKTRESLKTATAELMEAAYGRTGAAE